MSWLRDVDRWFATEVLPYQSAFQSFARRLTGNAEIARDLVQEAYAQALLGDRWQKARNAKVFVLRIVYCRSMDWLDKQKVIRIQQLPSFEDLAFADYGPDAFEALSGREELLVVLEILRGLPERCRQVVTMRRIEELPPAEIALRLGITVTTVERHLARGVSMLADQLATRGSLRRGRQAVDVTDTTQQAE